MKLIPLEKNYNVISKSFINKDCFKYLKEFLVCCQALLNPICRTMGYPTISPTRREELHEQPQVERGPTNVGYNRSCSTLVGLLYDYGYAWVDA